MTGTARPLAPEGRGASVAAESFLLFALAGGRFAVPVACVREIVRAVAVSPLPSAPEPVAGVIGVRGEPVPVLDLRRALGRADEALGVDEHFLLVRCGPRTVALRADHAEGVASFAADRLAAAEALVPGARHVAAVAGTAEGVVVVHDVESFLSAAEHRLLTRLLDAAGDGGARG
jgi:purine-binding chemotaxis protein CheW